MICFVDESLLHNAAVVAFDDGGTGYVVDGAEIVIGAPQHDSLGQKF